VLPISYEKSKFPPILVKGYSIMMHEYYEIPIARVIEMSNEEFLDSCARYLEESLEQDRKLDIDRMARDYGRRYLGIKDEGLPPMV